MLLHSRTEAGTPQQYGFFRDHRSASMPLQSTRKERICSPCKLMPPYCSCSLQTKMVRYICCPPPNCDHLSAGPACSLNCWFVWRAECCTGSGGEGGSALAAMCRLTSVTVIHSRAPRMCEAAPSMPLAPSHKALH